MPRTWRSQIADETRATSLMLPKCMIAECPATVAERGARYCWTHQREAEHAAAVEKCGDAIGGFASEDLPGDWLEAAEILREMVSTVERVNDGTRTIPIPLEFARWLADALDPSES